MNVRTGSTPSTRHELADLVIEIGGKTGSSSPVHQPNFDLTDRSAEREVSQRFCNTDKAKETLGWKPQVSLKQGLKMVLDSRAIFERWDTTELPYLQDELV